MLTEIYQLKIRNHKLVWNSEHVMLHQYSTDFRTNQMIMMGASLAAFLWPGNSVISQEVSVTIRSSINGLLGLNSLC